MRFQGIPQQDYRRLLYVGNADYGEFPVKRLSRSSGLLGYGPWRPRPTLESEDHEARSYSLLIDDGCPLNDRLPDLSER